MSTAFPERLHKWISARIADLTDEGPISRFDLVHTVEGEGAEKLQSFRAGEEGFEDSLDVCQAVWDVAYEDASTRDLGMSQRYVLAAWRGEEAREPDATHAFRIQGASVSDFSVSGNNTEPSTSRGARGQEMRHTENLHRMLMSMTEMTVGRVSRDLESERNRRQSAEEKLMKSFETQQQLLDRSHERELEMAKEEAKAKRHEELMGMVMAMAPLLLAKVMGGSSPVAGSLPASSARDHAISKLLGNLSEAEAMKVFEALQPHNQFTLMELYKSYREDHEKAEAQKPEKLRHGSKKESEEESLS